MSDAGAGEVQVSAQQRRLLAAVWGAIVLAVSACIFLGTWWSFNAADESLPSTGDSSSQDAAGVDGTPIAPSSAVPERGADLTDQPFGYGIQVQAALNTSQTLDQVQQLGMNWIRQPVRWADIEPEPGDLHWELLDDAFLGASARNLKVLVTVSDAPNWARSVTARNYDGPPDNVQAYVSFVSLLLQRYSGAIHAVEIWSEMNRDTEWYVAGGLSTADYLQLLNPTAAAIRAIDPTIIVISGGLNPTGVDDGIVAIDDFRYLREMIDLGLLAQVDCIGVHHRGYNLEPDRPYDALDQDASVLFQQPYDNQHHSWSFYSTLRGYHDIVVSAGYETPLCVTEFGWASIGGLPREPVPEFVYDNTLQEQADYIVEAYQLMYDWDFVWMGFLSNLDYSPEALGDDPEALAIYYRIVRADGSPRPAFEALQAMDKLP